MDCVIPFANITQVVWVGALFFHRGSFPWPKLMSPDLPESAQAPEGPQLLTADEYQVSSLLALAHN